MLHRKTPYQRLSEDLTRDLKEIYNLMNQGDSDLSSAAFGITCDYLRKEFGLTYLQASDLIHSFPEILNYSDRIADVPRVIPGSQPREQTVVNASLTTEKKLRIDHE